MNSRDLELDSEQQYVAQGVDMLIGQRAQVIIGNGVSSRFAVSVRGVSSSYCQAALSDV